MKKKKLKSKQTPVAPVKLTHVPPTYFQERRDAIVETIREAVEIESPTDNKHAVDRLGHWLASKFEALGGHSKFHRTADFGDHLQVHFPGRVPREPLLAVGPLDTVHLVVTLAS